MTNSQGAPGRPMSTVGEIAHRAVEVDVQASVLDVDEIFLADPGLRAVVARSDEGPSILVPRQHFQNVITGRRGYGRALHHNRVLAEMDFPDPLELPDHTAILEASRKMLARASEQRYDDVVVILADGALGLVSASAVMKCLAELYAYQAVHDPLTGLGNRARLLSFLGQIPPELLAETTVLFLDLDRFKVVNDSLGHGCGDELLIEIGQRIASCLRDGDLACRAGGDEFVVVLPAVSSLQVAEDVADRILGRVAEPIEIAGNRLRLSTSIGIAMGVADGEGPDELVRKADLAMYEAKAHGRARYAIFGRALDERAARLFSLDSRLRRAVELGEFFVEFQPVVDLRSGEVAKYEALVRWNDPTRGVVAPGDFIGMAEETGLILPLGQWVLGESIRQMRVCADHPGTAPALSVNVSTYQLLEADFVDRVVETLQAEGFPPERLCLEITETTALHDTESVRTNLSVLRSAGVGIALDDFGTGYSSLSLLRRLPLTEVKIDRSFIAGMLDAPEDADLVRMVIQVAHGLGYSVTAEGIEDPHQAEALRGMGCDLGQGYHLGVPNSLIDCCALAEPAAVRQDMAVAGG